MKINLLKEHMTGLIKNKTIEDVADENSCRYPLGEINDPPKYFCGKPLAYSNGWLYCKEHLKLCTNEKKT